MPGSHTKTGKYQTTLIIWSKKNKKEVFHPDSLLVVAGSDSCGKASCCCDTRSSKVRPESAEVLTPLKTDPAEADYFGPVSRNPPSNHSTDYISRAKMSIFAKACLDTH